VTPAIAWLVAEGRTVARIEVDARHHTDLAACDLALGAVLEDARSDRRECMIVTDMAGEEWPVHLASW
jgi:hypothetical protein